MKLEPYKLNEKSDLAQSLRQYVLAKINYDIEREKFSRRIKAKVPAPGIKKQLSSQRMKFE